MISRISPFQSTNLEEEEEEERKEEKEERDYKYIFHYITWVVSVVNKYSISVNAGSDDIFCAWHNGWITLVDTQSIKD